MIALTCSGRIKSSKKYFSKLKLSVRKRRNYMTKQVLLTCGAGASSGFMAAAARKAAKKLGADVEVKAKSETEVAGLLPETDLLLVAPHLKYMIDEVKELCETNNVKYDIIPQRVYGSLDGKGLIEFALKKFEAE